MTPAPKPTSEPPTSGKTNMQHIKRINDSTFHVTIGDRVLELIGSNLTPETVKQAIRMWHTADPAQRCRITDITERLRLEVESNLISVSKELGCRGVERYSDDAMHLRHPFGLIRAGWSRRDHNWTISTDQDIYVCDPDAVSVRKALVFLLDDVVNKDDTSIPLGLYIAVGLSIVGGAVAGFVLGAAVWQLLF